MNDQLYEGIKKSLIEDIKLAYEVFKEEEHENLEGVILALNPLRGFGQYLMDNPAKMAEFTEYLFVNTEFVVHLAFDKECDDEFFPLIEN